MELSQIFVPLALNHPLVMIMNQHFYWMWISYFSISFKHAQIPHIYE